MQPTYAQKHDDLACSRRFDVARDGRVAAKRHYEVDRYCNKRRVGERDPVLGRNSFSTRLRGESSGPSASVPYRALRFCGDADA